MVRCEEFYRKWKDDKNFCFKDPDTADRIDKYIELLPELDKAIAKSKTLSASSPPMGGNSETKAIITERASRPLTTRIKKPDDLEKALAEIVKKAEDKKRFGKKLQVTYMEVDSIVNEIIPSSKPKTSKPPEYKLDKAIKQVMEILGDLSSITMKTEIANSIDSLISFLMETKDKLDTSGDTPKSQAVPPDTLQI